MLKIGGFAVQYLYGARLFGGVDAEFRDGEIISVYGGEGSGKSSFLKGICGAAPAEGSVLLDGRPVGAKTDDVVMVFQDGAVFPFKSVYDNLAYPLAIRGTDKAEIARKVLAAAEEMGITACLNMRARSLSLAEKRRMSLARMAVRKARLYIADAPTAGLAREDAESVFEDLCSLMRRLAAEGGTVIYSTSDRAEALAAADRIAVLVGGELKQLGSAYDIRRAPASVWAAQAVDKWYNFIKCTLTDENGRMKLVFGEDDVLDAEALRGRVPEGYVGSEVLAGWFPEDAAGEKTSPLVYAVGERCSHVSVSAEGIAERGVGRKDEVRIRPDVAKVTLFDRTNEFSIMSDGSDGSGSPGEDT